MPQTDEHACPPEVLRLAERFEANKDHYKAPAYKEAQVRQEFVNPFFKALGWDVDNTEGRAEAYKDVVHEDTIQIQGRAKAPDYAFKVGTARKFFVETKKPAVNVKMHAESAFQLRRYARSAKLPLSILTDFEEFAVYDTRVRPLKSDSPSKARVLYITYKEYEKRWPEIAAIFSREAIYQGAFDKFAESKRKRGTTEIDDDFLDTIREWRELLAKDIFKNNDLSERQLNRDVQAIIDRIIFLRICEDRGVEDFARVLKLKDEKPIYPALVDLFRAADDRYNSGLFHFNNEPGRPSEPDTSTPGLTVSDRVLKRIIDDLYYPNQYEFRVFPPDVLGQVYERFLGDVISVSNTGKSVKVEPKPEVRKAGGVYYTPTYIVEYIVKHTVGELVKDKPPHEVAGRTAKQFKPAKGAHPLRALDPACGSGSFLLGAYQFLLDWFREQYAKDPDRWTTGPSPTLWQAATNDYRLTIAERKRILLDHIYGVDIDRQAVEVTKLSLLLKCLEGESSDTIGAHLFHMNERALPDLAANIKCGNSLIGSDFYKDKDPDEFTLEDRMRINAFDWEQEFKPVFADGGFDAVIGNPPYVFGRDWNALGIPDSIKEYCRKHFVAGNYQLDMFALFVEQSSYLTRAEGYAGQIVPNVWLSNDYSKELRKLVFAEYGDIRLTRTPPDVFRGVTVETTIATSKRSAGDQSQILIAEVGPAQSEERWSLPAEPYRDGKRPISLATDPASLALIEKLALLPVCLEQVADVTRGIHPYRIGGYGQSAYRTGTQSEKDVKNRPYHNSKQLKGYRPFVYGKDLRRLGSILARDYVDYGPWLAEPRNSRFFEGSRVYSRKILSTGLIATPVHDNSTADQQVYITKPTDGSEYTAEALAAVLASPLVGHFIRHYFDEADVAFPQVKVKQLKRIPLPESPSESVLHEMRMCVSDRLKADSQLAKSRTSDERRILQQQIDATDREIDRLVYELYGLTDEEIAIVEATTAPANPAP